MDFKPNYPIYLQVADYICEKVLTHQWADNAKLPSVKDLSVAVAVNPNTVIKSLGFLVDNGILSIQRGIGYFLTEQAFELTLQLKRKQFVDEVLPDVFADMQLLQFNIDELVALHKEHSSSEKA